MFGAVAGVMLGVFDKTSSTFRDKVAAGLKYGITGDASCLDGFKDGSDDRPGQYL